MKKEQMEKEAIIYGKIILKKLEKQSPKKFEFYKDFLGDSMDQSATCSGYGLVYGKKEGIKSEEELIAEGVEKTKCMFEEDIKMMKCLQQLE